MLYLISCVSACSLIPGYFYQVTALKGQVVGTRTHVAFLPRWLRQSIPRKHSKLKLYKYEQPWDDTLIVKTVETDEHGNCDFGALKIGHYMLRIDDNDIFDVEVKDMPRITKSVTIDASPIYPDCTGGHEFIVWTM
jgi:hypothetical protein